MSKACDCGGFWQGVVWVHAERCNRPRNQDFTRCKNATHEQSIDDALAEKIDSVLPSCRDVLAEITRYRALHPDPDGRSAFIGAEHDIEFALRMLDRAVARLRGKRV